MKIDYFLQNYHEWICSNSDESQFAALQVLLPGLSSPKLAKLLNKAVGLIEKDEFYCEIGSFSGYTLISASLNNMGHKCVGIDDFRFFGTEEKKNILKERFVGNLKPFLDTHISFLEEDYKNVSFTNPLKMAVFLADGDHTKEEIIANLEWAHPKLADRALIFCDDIMLNGVGEGVKEFLKDHDEFSEIFRMEVHYPNELPIVLRRNNIFWNGLSILKFERKSGEI